jgi:hypothetical protein
MDDNLLKDLKAFCIEHNTKLKDLIYELKNSQKQVRQNEVIEKVNANKKLVGLCFRKKVKPRSGMFPEMYRYYRIISERALTEYNVSCLIFDEIPTYWFDYQASLKGSIGDYFLGEFDFNPIWIDSININSLQNMEQIHEGIFKYELNSLGNKINALPWCADHYRYGDKLPTDDGWEIADAGV